MLTDEYVITDKQIEFYHSQGYLGVENVLSDDEVNDLRRVTSEFVEKSRAVTEADDVFDLEPEHTPENPQIRRIKMPYKQHPVYDATVRHERILNIISQLIGYGIRCNGHKLNMKLDKLGSPVQWHQDWAFYPHTNDDLLAVGVAIDDMTTENGCLMVIPGSHKGKIYDHYQNGKFVGAVTDPEFKPEGAVPIELKAGGISIHHVRMLHGSAINTSNGPRRLLLASYCAVDAWPLTTLSKHQLEQFKGEIIQGDVNTKPRAIEVPVRFPVPGDENDKPSSIYSQQSELENPIFDIKDSQRHF
jgi:phytanoyl-CoA hydroxylase